MRQDSSERRPTAHFSTRAEPPSAETAETRRHIMSDGHGTAGSPFFEQFFSQPQSPRITSSDEPPGGTLGDYELLELLGQGGMGVVFRARQRKVNRLVALKVIRPERLTGLAPDKADEILERFRSESRAAAQLEHDHIVTVYDVGEANGQQYFSMRYVQGPSLAQILDDGPLDSRRAAEYMESVSRAVEEAHGHGILHRDLKPQNILVDAKTDRALVTDFGLAKWMEQEGGLTRAGELMGTPQYMAPEQARDSTGVTKQSDVYGLGATLYHLLTGRPVFQAATSLETLRQVLDATPVPPRQLNPAIDRDLNTICLKCLEKAPSQRYDSAGMLAEDLRRYLDGRPILARPVGRWARLGRWGRRNPVVAGLSALVAACLLATLIAVTVAYIKTSAALTRSEASLRHALATVNEFFTQVSEETLLDQPGLQPLRQQLLERARDYYQGFLRQRAGDPSFESELAETHYRVGLITELLESADRAIPSFDRAVTLQTRLAAEHPGSPEYLAALGNTLNAKGKAFYELDRLDDALDVFEKARQIRTKTVELAPQELDYRRKLANSLMNIGVIFQARGDFGQAREQFDQAQSLREELRSRHGDDPRLLRDLARGYFNRSMLNDPDDRSAMLSNLDRAIDCFQTLVAEEDSTQDRFSLGLCYEQQALAQEIVSRKKDLLYVAVNHLEPLAIQNPQVDEYQVAAARIHIYLGELRSDDQAAQDSLERAVAILTRLVSRNAEPRYQLDLAYALQHLAVADGAQAREHFDRASHYLNALVAEFPNNEEYRHLQQQNEAAIAALAHRTDTPQ